MKRELIKKQIELKFKPQARPMPIAQAKALLARYGQKYNPGGQDQSKDSQSTKNEE